MSEELSIDQLAARSGVPSRTIRQYQTAGLLPPPERKGRIGVYLPHHLERLSAIGRLQERGYSLAGMLDLFQAWALGRGLHQVIGSASRQANSSGSDRGPVEDPEPAPDEAPMLIDHGQLLDVLPWLSKASLRREAISARLISRRKAPETGWMVRSPASLALVAELVEAGVAPTDAIAVHVSQRTAAQLVAAHVAKLILVIEPDARRAAFLRRNRTYLGRATATLVIDAVGDALPVADRNTVRIGAVRDQRTSKPRKAARSE
jgi:DNA-binding transcriptional MerR regulator